MLLRTSARRAQRRQSPTGLAGGGAQIQGLADRIEDAVKMRVWVAEDSMTCVARGAGRVLEDLDNYGRVLVSLDRGSTHH